MPVYSAARMPRGFARAGFPAALLALTGLLIGLPAPRADGSHTFTQRATREKLVAPQFTNVRDLIRSGVVHRPRLQRPIPLGTWNPPGVNTSAPRAAGPGLFSTFGPGSQAPGANVI